ncbi:uncharacterized protein LOC125882893 [Epinephelus fuscoguttatus]|uniref:uncharacterized protein LOC125882893 n=1 Tax=Epinephelus fuscoguttatus TaxID=293821 RepID=UPI0020D01722|nr:uncharacterized protein LOC125882893 [Epinephelus fuscoguttatus]
MPRPCAYPNCRNKMSRYNPRSFHRLPYSDMETLKSWLVVLQMDANTPVATLRLADHRVCGDHFDRDDYCQTKKTPNPKLLRLKKNAVPRVEVSEASSSVAMEVMGLQRGLNHLLCMDVDVGVMNTERSPSIGKVMSDTDTNIHHKFNPWHACKREATIDPESPDFAPSLLTYPSESQCMEAPKKLDRFTRKRKRKRKRSETISNSSLADTSDSITAAQVSSTVEPTSDSQPPDCQEELTDCLVAFTATVSDHTDTSSSAPPADPPCRSVHTRWMDPTRQDHDYCKKANGKDVHDKTTQVDEFGYFILQNDADALLHTGIPLETFNILVSTLEGHAYSAFTLSVRDQVLMTLMKLKTNCETDDLSRQFYVSQGMASRVISYWIDKLDQVLRPLIPWPPKETLQATMPGAFKRNFPDTTCILEFSQSRLQKRKNPDSYKTVKYQVAVAPCGLIMFISAIYERRCNDTFITKNSGILDFLKPGDEVMAVRGVTIEDLLFEKEVKLVVPSFTEKGPAKERVRVSRRIEHQFERAVGRLKMYKIISQVVPNAMAQKISKILRICAALVNLREDLMRDSH